MLNPLNPLVEKIMIPFLSFSYNFIYPNYGVAIILLTLIVKIGFYPLTKKQFYAMKLNQILQPQIKKIQEKYKDQPEKLQKELLAFWKEHKANPFSGCLPLLIQIPVFIAIFTTINSPLFKDLLSQPGVNTGLFSFWLSNLGQADKTLILPLIISISTYWSQKIMTVDPKQAQLFALMPVLMFIISWKMPAGVLLYWAVSTVVTTLQQIYIMKLFDKTHQGKVTTS